MNFQSKILETAADFPARAVALTEAVIEKARGQSTANADRVARIRTSLSALQLAGRELNKLARRHVSRFVKQNSTIARDAGKEVSALARSAYEQISKREAAGTRKSARPTARKRTPKRGRTIKSA